MSSEHSTADVTVATATEAGPNEPFIIGITGTRGSGKSAVGDILRANSVPVIDADKLAHEFYNGPNEVYDQVLDRFGTEIVHSEGGPIDRAKLSAIVESDDQALCDLEAIVHPPLFALMAKRMEAMADEPVIAIEMPLVHEKGKKDVFDAVWCVVAREDVLIPRLMARNGITEDRARQQLAMQLPQIEKSHLSDLTINNSGSLEELEAQVLKYLGEINSDGSTGDNVDTDDGSTGTDNPDGGEAGNSGDCGPDNPNEHYLARLREFAEIGTEAALERMGKVSETGHRTAEATMRMEVGCDDESGTNGPDRELEVTVKMGIRNKGTGSDDRNDDPEPTPPPANNGGSNGWNRNVILFCVTALVISLLAFLAFLLSNDAQSHHHVDRAPTIVNVEVVNNTAGCIPNCAPVKVEKPEPVVIEAQPPAQVVDKEPTKTGCGSATGFREVAEIPGYAFRNTLNAVRPRIATWYEKQLADCGGWVVQGREADNRMVVHQVFDGNYWMDYQLVFTYFRDRSIQVDRYQGALNNFVGRSILQVDQDGYVTSARLLDGLQRPVLEVDMELTSTGQVFQLSYQKLDAKTGVVQEAKTVSGRTEADAYMHRHFYGYDWFAVR